MMYIVICAIIYALYLQCDTELGGDLLYYQVKTAICCTFCNVYYCIVFYFRFLVFSHQHVSTIDVQTACE